MCRPLHESRPLARSGCYSMTSDGGYDTGVCESWGGGDDGVGDEVVNALHSRAMLAMQDLEQS